MEADDEFGDEIDWSAVQLPSVSAPAAAAASGAPPGGNATNGHASTTGAQRHSWGGGGAAVPSHHQHLNLGPPAQSHVGGYGQNFAAAPIGSAGAHVTNNFASANDLEALRRQVASLQNQLQAKDDQIFELEATAATSAAESNHRTQKAEAEARERVRLAEEEARRARAEAERYRGGYIRHKKRAAELEAGQRQENENGTNRPNNGPGNLGAWGPPVADVEMRKVTPVTEVTEDDASPSKGGEEGASPAQSAGSKKRKARGPIDVDAALGGSKLLPVQVLGAGKAIAVGGDTTRQRLARHLLEREEMGCYSFRDASAGIEATAKMDADNYSLGEQQLSTTQHPRGVVPFSKAMRQDMRIDEETMAFVKSVLFQMAEAPDSVGPGMPAAGNLSGSGLVRVLLLRFDSLFNCVKSKNGDAVDGDGDHVMGEDDEQNSSDNGDQPSKSYQRMALALLSSGEGERSPVTHKTVSWRAALRLLRVLHDILLLSGNAREDLRWWFYQSRQSSAGGDVSDDASPSKAGSGESVVGDATRIEGLPASVSSRRSKADCREVLWTPDCRSRSGQSDVWDSTTMANPFNSLFELLVGIMQGNTIDCSKDASKDEATSSGPEQTLVRSVQLKAFDVVLALMSDAPPYDHAKDSDGNRTPYLWKFWFDSLLPSHPDGQAPVEMGDLLSIWKKGSSIEGQQDQLPIHIKSRILQLLSHFMQGSSSVHRSLRHNANDKEKKSITKRILSAILGDLEERVVPFLSSDSGQGAEQHLELCQSCLHFLLILSRSNEGIRMLRLQMRLESEAGKPSRWSQSAVGFVALVLDGTLSFASEIEERERAMLKSTHLAQPLKAIVNQCVSFFKNLLLFVDQQRTSSRPVTFSSLVQEHLTIFQSAIERVLALQPPSCVSHPPRLLHCSEGLKRDVQEILAEIAEDRKEEGQS